MFRYQPPGWREPISGGWRPAEVPPVPALPVMTTYHDMLVPLSIIPGCNTDAATRYANCAQALRTGLPEIVSPGQTVCEAPCVIVGTGFSAVKLLPEIRTRYEAGEEIIAVKGSHDYLVKKGIIPTAAIAVDAQASRAKIFTPVKGVLYLCASQMHPDTWPHMKRAKVVLFHVMIEPAHAQRPDWKGKLIFPPATTTGGQAKLVMYTLGRNNIHLYGFDSSFPKQDVGDRQPIMKLDGGRVAEGTNIHEVVAAGRTYYSTPELVLQVQELKTLIPMLDGATVNPHGDGYYQAAFAEAKSKGLI
jgi:hypothetical protein